MQIDAALFDVLRSLAGGTNTPAAQSKPSTILVNGEEVPIQNGVASYKGADYRISRDGTLVADTQKRIVGSINRGVFEPTTPALVEQLRRRGLLAK